MGGRVLVFLYRQNEKQLNKKDYVAFSQLFVDASVEGKSLMVVVI